mmetsp:Transcript_13740/g.24653  ORF Transcript_13740/g.24653 Transcript_13740/m.24653 type:complete len:453 (-) Transcript_13740:109-1467(-)|eukprot:CAMPEP_0182445476 /NCGR_PEP_ID=MMETSP1172-20130603/3589_1 /TAXON_ID=708627 /ORGANISM="Timspurckia oligopyrenoides, Strain CCMP3278" /LENGTH=452 /DNA_ID=CAMNT_0024641259 /DNA_START=74 /DNA_END=1435 /DNA_ORIENTATION=-
MKSFLALVYFFVVLFQFFLYCHCAQSSKSIPVHTQIHFEYADYTQHNHDHSYDQLQRLSVLDNLLTRQHQSSTSTRLVSERNVSLLGFTERVSVSGSSSSFEVTFSSSFPEQAQTAFRSAVQLWADSWINPSQSVLTIDASWNALPQGVLAATLSLLLAEGNGQDGLLENTMYTAAFAKSVTGQSAWRGDDIVIQFNSQANWNYAAENPSRTEFDLETVAAHELGHGLFFDGQLRRAMSQQFGESNVNTQIKVGTSSAPYPSRFDDFVTANSGGGVVLSCSSVENNSSALTTAVTSSGLYFYAPQTQGGNFSLYAPDPFADGSSVYHLVEDDARVFSDCQEAGISREECSDLMTPALPPGYVQRKLGENTLRIMRAMFSSANGSGIGSCDVVTGGDNGPGGLNSDGVPQWVLITLVSVASVFAALAIIGIVTWNLKRDTQARENSYTAGDAI